MDPEVAVKLRAEFPEGETWGWDRLVAERSIFWDRDHKRLTNLTDRQILIALIWAQFYAGQWGAALKLYFDEGKLWRRHFAILSKVAALLLFLILWCPTPSEPWEPIWYEFWEIGSGTEAAEDPEKYVNHSFSFASGSHSVRITAA